MFEVGCKICLRLDMRGYVACDVRLGTLASAVSQPHLLEYSSRGVACVKDVTCIRVTRKGFALGHSGCVYGLRIRLYMKAPSPNPNLNPSWIFSKKPSG